MSKNVGNSLHSPFFIKAKSAEQLHKAMLTNNIKWSMEFQYFSIYESKNVHYAWYYFDHKLLKSINRSENE